MQRLLILTTHPIQYNAPLFKCLAESHHFILKVFYSWGQSEAMVHDPGFGIDREWDIDLLERYDHKFINNKSFSPGSDHFLGIINPTIISEVEKFDPDAILLYGWKFHSHLKVMRHFKGKVPIFFRGDSTMSDQPDRINLRKPFRQFLLQWVYGHVDKVLSPGSLSDNYFLHAGVRKNQIIRAPHTIDNDRFSVINSSLNGYDSKAKAWRIELGIPDNAIVFLFAGKLEHKKNPEILLRAFSELAITNSHIYLIIVGNGKLENNLKIIASSLHNSYNLINTSKIHSAHRPNNTVFLPFQNQSMMPVVYRLADVFVLPSQGPGETWGLAVNEAMASGKPIIVSDKCGCAQELVEEGVNGYTFKSGSAQDLISKMQLMLNRSDLKSMGESSKQIISTFNYDTFADALHQCFAKINA